MNSICSDVEYYTLVKAGMKELDRLKRDGKVRDGNIDVCLWIKPAFEHYGERFEIALVSAIRSEWAVRFRVTIKGRVKASINFKKSEYVCDADEIYEFYDYFRVCLHYAEELEELGVKMTRHRSFEEVNSCDNHVKIERFNELRKISHIKNKELAMKEAVRRWDIMTDECIRKNNYFDIVDMRNDRYRYWQVLRKNADNEVDVYEFERGYEVAVGERNGKIFRHKISYA